MKITKLKIEEFQQFRNLELDFTYPDGHEKAGKPLEKVCFLGQSGTGKTRLLHIFRNLIHQTVNEKFEHEEIHLNGNTFHIEISETEQASGKILIHFHSDIMANANMLDLKPMPEEPMQLFNEPQVVYETKSTQKTPSQFIDFSNNYNENVWKNLFENIKKYDESFGRASKELGQNISGENSENAIKKFEDWKKENPNPRTRIAQECLDPMLDYFNLKLNTNGTDNIYFSFQNKDNQKVPPHGLSTGTKQIILTALPIYLFDTKNTIILFDEPERSLFPDIQLKIVDYYTRLAPEVQFFFATHSPMVAAAFEPCERFILRFDENGYVTSDSVYKGDSPIGDDPNDMLFRDFGIRTIINEHGTQQWEHYLNLKNKLKTEKNEEKKQELMLEVVKLGNRYNYPA